MTPERAKEIIQQARDATTVGPWSDQLRNVMTTDERVEVLKVWRNMPGCFCFVDALNKIARGRS